MSSNARVHGAPGTLYARCGGAFGVAAFVDYCMDKWMEDKVLNANKLVATWHEKQQRCGFKFLLSLYLCDRMGGPHRYTGRPLDVSHKYLNIRQHEWKRFIETFDAACKDFGLDPKTAMDVKALIESVKDQCVVREGERVPPNPGVKPPGGWTLYEKLGGVYTITIFVDRLVDALLTDDRVHVPHDGQKRNEASLKFFFTEVVCNVTGGPEAITCKDYDETKLLVPGPEWQIFMATAEAAADHFPQEQQISLMKVLQQSRHLIVDPASSDEEAPLAAVLLTATRVKDVQTAAAGRKLSRAVVAERHAAPGAHVAARRRVYGDPRTLYGRGGGVFGLARLSCRLMDAWMSNPLLNANHMVARWHESQQKYGFKFLVTQILGYLTGGPQRYTGRSMEAAHKHLSISEQQWESFMDDADRIFSEFGVETMTKKELLSILEGFRGSVALGKGETAPPDPGPSQPSTTLSHTLFYRLGGVYPIARFVDQLVDAVLADRAMHVDFRDSKDLDGRRQTAGLKYLVTELLCEGTGGEEVVTSKGLDEAKLGVPMQEWPLFIKHAEEAGRLWSSDLWSELSAALEAVKAEICIDVAVSETLCSEADTVAEKKSGGGAEKASRPSTAGSAAADGTSKAAARGAAPQSLSDPAAPAQSRCPFSAFWNKPDGSGASAPASAAAQLASGSSELWNDVQKRGMIHGRQLGSELQDKLDGLLSEDPSLCCPISLMLFVDPVKASDGFVYENVSIKILSRSKMVSPMSHEALKEERADAGEERDKAMEFRRSRSSALLDFVEESVPVDPSMAMTGLERVSEYVQVLKPDNVPALVKKASQCWEKLDKPVPPELVGASVRRRSRAQSLNKTDASAILPQQQPQGKKTEADFRAYLDVLLSAEDAGEVLARKLYDRFEGDVSRLPQLLQLLEDRWGFPARLSPLLWTHLRRAVFTHRGEHVDLCMESTAVESLELSEQEWAEAFVRWLQAIAARTCQAQVKREKLVQKLDASVDFDDVYFAGPKLGEGAYGEVFLMFHKNLGEERVVKVINLDQMNMANEAVQAEVDILKSLDHPGIVRIYETFEKEDKLLIVMDYAEGGDLSSVLRKMQDEERVLPEVWCRAATEQILAALEYIHEKGVIHCDLKPANAMLLKPFHPQKVDAMPHLLLVDFGLAELFVGRHRDGPVQVKGTPLYLSPEAFEGHVTEKSDMWAVGVMIYEMLLGEKPFKETSVFALWAKVSRTVPPFDKLPEFPREVVKALMTKDPAARLRAKECRTLKWFSCQLSSPNIAPKSDDGTGSMVLRMRPDEELSYFRRAAMFCIATELSMKDMAHIYQVFQEVDKDKTGCLTLDNLKEALELLGSQQDPKQLMEQLDMDQNGSISYTEFLAGSLSREAGLSDRHLRQAFDMFDLDGDGTISLHELRCMLSGDGPLVDVLPDGQTVTQLLDEVGQGLGHITFDNFCKYLSKTASTEDATRRRRASTLMIRSRGVDQMFEDLDAKSNCSATEVNLELGKEDIRDAARVPEADKRPTVHDAPPLQQDAELAPLHKWLTAACNDPPLAEVLREVLSFPNRRLDTRLAAVHLPAVTRHLMACICLMRFLAKDDAPKDEEELKKAVMAATQDLVKAAISRKDESGGCAYCPCRQRRRLDKQDGQSTCSEP